MMITYWVGNLVIWIFGDSIMPMIRVQDWTKEQLEEIKDEEDHTSLDSVVKTLLKERANETNSANE
jgi:hypothetical protein